MKVKSLRVKGFRNYEAEEIAFSPATNIIFGRNAQGKTNLLEAIYLFSHGRSHRAKYDTELIRFGNESARLMLEFSDKDRDFRAEMQLNKNGKKSIKINNVPITKLSMLMRYLNVVMFSPEDLDIVKGAPQVRRRFLDEAISQIYPTYLKILISYHKNLAQKNNLLKKMRKTGKTDDAMLDVWNEQISADGAKIMEYRKSYVEKLRDYAEVIHKEISGEIFNLDYTPSIECDIIDRDSFFEKLCSSKSREIEVGTSLYGIQRDDLQLTIGGKVARTYASQGQQRTGVLSMKMAQMETINELREEYPVLLLDDIMSELDSKRRQYLAERIVDKQVILTCTDTDFGKVGGETELFEIKEGRIIKQEKKDVFASRK